jgi:hypothetical protein
MQEPKKLKRFEYSSVEELMNDQLDLSEALQLAKERQDINLYVEGVDDGYAGVAKKEYISEAYTRGYKVGQEAKAKEERFKEFKEKLAKYKAEKK